MWITERGQNMSAKNEQTPFFAGMEYHEIASMILAQAEKAREEGHPPLVANTVYQGKKTVVAIFPGLMHENGLVVANVDSWLKGVVK